MELRHALSYRVPRGRRSDPQFTQAAAPPVADWPAEALVSARRVRIAYRRRGRRYDPPFVVTSAPPVSTWPAPRGVASRRRIAALRRRGDRWEPQFDQACAPGIVQAERRRTVRPRRGQVFSRPWNPQESAPPPYVPQSLRVRVKPVLRRRGRLAQPPWAQQAPTPPPVFVPAVVRTRRRLLAARRTRVLVIPQGQDMPLRASRARSRLPIRVRRAPLRVLLATQPMPATIRCRRRLQVTLRRGKSAQLPWSQIVVVQSNTWTPSWIRGRRPRPALLPCRGRTLFIVGVQRGVVFAVIAPGRISGTSAGIAEGDGGAGRPAGGTTPGRAQAGGVGHLNWPEAGHATQRGVKP